MGLVTEPIVALKRSIRIKPKEKVSINLIISVGEDRIKTIENIKKYKIEGNIEKAFELSKAKNEAQSRYLRIKGTDIRKQRKRRLAR